MKALLRVAAYELLARHCSDSLLLDDGDRYQF
jgi:hypothetical protein